jgi:acyl-CoA thioesterase FadM
MHATPATYSMVRERVCQQWPFCLCYVDQCPTRLCSSIPFSGRHKALASLGLHVEGFQERGTLMALSDLALSYRAPLRAGDSFVVTTAISGVTAARIVIEHTVLQLPRPARADNNESISSSTELPAQSAHVLACSGRATVVFLDASYRPVRVPADIRGVFEKLIRDRALEG